MEPLSLLDLLSYYPLSPCPGARLTLQRNGYLLLATTPYLLPEELLALSRCSRSFHALVTQSPSVWRHVDLSAAPSSSTALSPLGTSLRCRPAQLLRQPHVLRDVQTLVLDGLLSVTTQLLRELLCSTTTPQYRIRLLSIRRCPNLDSLQLSGLFRHLARPARERRLGELRGCYLFSDMDSTEHVRLVQPRKGRFVDRQSLIDNDKTEHDWVATLQACAGELAFDTRLCSGPRHSQYHDHNHDDHNHDYNHNNHSHHAGAHEIPAPAPASTPFPDRIACVRLTGGCAVCHSSPEARLRRKTPGQGSGHELPPVVIAPVPLTTSSLRAACSVPGYDGDDGGARQDVLRCETCVTNRMCNKCDRWWCETCVDPDQAADKVDRSLAR